MFIENLSKSELTYRAHGRVLKLKVGINLVEEVFFTQDELKRHFGSLINIYATNATLVEKPRKVDKDEKNEEFNSSTNNEDTNLCGDNANEPDQEPKGNESFNENNGEETCLAIPDTNNSNIKEPEQNKAQTETEPEAENGEETEKDKEEKKPEGNKIEVGETNEGKPEGEVADGETEDISKLKRPQLIAKYKELGLEGSPVKLSNDALIEAITIKLGK